MQKRKYIRPATLYLALMLMITLLSGCGIQEKILVGTWKEVGVVSEDGETHYFGNGSYDSVLYTFYNDGTGSVATDVPYDSFVYEVFNYQFQWRVTDDTLILLVDGSGYIYQYQLCKLTPSELVLALGGRELHFKR
ncbi:MAG: lipocalin family protein [Faecousia sp.]